MTRATNARIAGFTFLAYIAAGLTSMVLFRRAAGGEGVAAKLAGIAAHATDVGVLVILGLVQCFSALVLGVTLYAITRDEDGDLAMLGLVCRVGEGFIAALSIPAMLALFWLATASGAGAPDTAATHALAAYLLRDDVGLTATFFAVGSTAFAYLLLRGRMIPVRLAWLGLVASAVLVLGLPLQLAGWVRGPITSVMWLPMLAFEVPLGLWLLTRGVAADG
ncbi:MAG TPA: DUF4386 domain-containing protein [Gemmatimonadales bacterium]|jgi:hypothetical protein